MTATAAMMFGSMAAPARAHSFRVAGFREPAVTHAGFSDPVHNSAQAQGKRTMKSEPRGTSFRAATARVLSETEVRDFVADAVDELKGSDKEVARIVDAAPPTVGNWRGRRNTMSLTHFVRLCRQHPAFKAAARQLLQMESALDPRTEAKLVELQRALAETLERGR